MFIEGLARQLLKELLSDSENLTSLAVDATAYYKERYVKSGYLESLEKELADTQAALKNLVKVIEAGIFSDSPQERLQELERRKKADGQSRPRRRRRSFLKTNTASRRTLASSFMRTLMTMRCETWSWSILSIRFTSTTTRSF